MKMNVSMFLLIASLSCCGAETVVPRPPDLLRLFEDQRTRNELTQVYKLPAAKITEAKQDVEDYKSALERLSEGASSNQAPTLRDTANRRLQALFTSGQVELLQRVIWRKQGAEALFSPNLDPSLAEKLSLTPLQKERLAEASKEFDAQRRALLDGLPRVTPKFLRQQEAPMREQQQITLRSILTEQQHRNWDELTAVPSH